MDDPLSAVDAHVGKHLFEKAIQEYWKEKLVLLVTNQLQYLPYANNVIFLNDGEVIGDGTFTELLESSLAFKEQMHKYGVAGEKKAEGKKQEEKKEVKTAEKSTTEIGKIKESISINRKYILTVVAGTLIFEEDKQTGLIGWNIYWYYIKKGRAVIFFFMALCLLLSVGSRVVSSWWLTEWTKNTYNLSQETCK